MKIKLIQQGTIRQLVDPIKQAAVLTKPEITTYVKEAPTNEKSLLCKAILVVGVMGLLRVVGVMGTCTFISKLRLGQKFSLRPERAQKRPRR